MEAEDAPLARRLAGERLTARLVDLPEVTAVRGWGLLVAAELMPGLDAPVVAAHCLDTGLIVNAVTPTALRLAPPLLVTDAEIDEAVELLGVALAASQEANP